MQGYFRRLFSFLSMNSHESSPSFFLTLSLSPSLLLPVSLFPPCSLPSFLISFVSLREQKISSATQERVHVRSTHAMRVVCPFCLFRQTYKASELRYPPSPLHRCLVLLLFLETRSMGWYKTILLISQQIRKYLMSKDRH